MRRAGQTVIQTRFGLVFHVSVHHVCVCIIWGRPDARGVAYGRKHGLYSLYKFTGKKVCTVWEISRRANLRCTAWLSGEECGRDFRRGAWPR